MTPRRLEAMMFIARKREQLQRLEELRVAALANGGDEKSLKAFQREMES